MFGRWLFVRIRAAERAAHEGRIDEAYAAAAAPDVREHRRGQRVLDELVRPLVARARLHLQAGRWQDALSDLDQLQAVGRGGPEAQELRERVLRQMRDRQERDADRRRREADRREEYDRAAGKLDQGRLESGRLEIERVDDPGGRQELREQLDVRVQRSSQLLDQASEALQRGEVLAALHVWQEICQRHGRSRASDEFAARLAPACRQSLDEWFAEGRFERFLSTRASLGALGQHDPTLGEYEQIAALCGRAVRQLGARDFPGLRQTLLRLKAARGAVSWIDQGLEALTRINEAQDLLLASPLGLYASTAGSAPAAPHAGAPAGAADPFEKRSLEETRVAAPPAELVDPTAAELGRQPLLLLVDGAGSSLIVPQDTVRIGQAGGSQPIDVPIPADVLSHHADIVRDGEDYFLIAHGPVRVNQRQVKRTLLRDGQRVVLGDRAKFLFRKPSAKSGSAVLKTSHRCRLPQDVSDVVLFRDTCLIGPQSSCHIRMREGDTQVVLFDRGGRLYGRSAASGGGKLGDAKPLRLGETIDFGEVRVTLKVYELPDSSRLT